MRQFIVLFVLGSLFISLSSACFEIQGTEMEIAEKTTNVNEKNEVLEDIVVTASKIPQSSKEITHKVDILSYEYIQGVNYTNRR